MTSSLQQEKSITTGNQKMKNDSLNRIFHCLETCFAEKITSASNEFLGGDFHFSLKEVALQPNPLWKTNDYFVTQINLAQGVNIVLKISDTAANTIFLSSLGKREDEDGYFELKKITELEATILTSYNEFLYNNFKDLFLNSKEINSVLHTVEEEKTLYLMFYVYTNDEQEAGRIVLSVPEFVFKKIEPISQSGQTLGIDLFDDSIIETDILIGKTSASLDDIKSIEPEDLIILDKSNLYTMSLRNFEGVNINVTPNSDLIVDFDEEDGDDIVSEQKNVKQDIWDSLEVDVNACFEKVKIKLGDLREITEGLVVDVASVADNRVFIDVEGKKLAAGELVIIGDKYGVKITEIFGDGKTITPEEGQVMEVSRQKESESYEEQAGNDFDDDDEDDVDNMDIDEDFDESDFDMDDDDDDDDY